MPLLLHAVAVVDAVADGRDVALAGRRRRRAGARRSSARPSRPGSRGRSGLRRARWLRSVAAARSQQPRERQRARVSASSASAGMRRGRCAASGGGGAVPSPSLSSRGDQDHSCSEPGGLRAPQPLADGPSARRTPWRRLAAVLLVAWLLVDPRTPDLAAQVYRVGLFRELGFSVWDEHWYARPPPARLQPAVPGARVAARRAAAGGAVGAGLDASCSSGWSSRATASARAGRRRGSRWRPLGDVWIGRLTFALGVTLRAGGSARADAPTRSLAAGVAGGAVRGRQPGRRRCCSGWPALTVALVRRSPRRAAGAGGARRGGGAGTGGAVPRRRL